MSESPKLLAAWRSRMVKVPESVFLDLARNYIGDVKTPFNKQEILQRLESFLTLPETKSRISAFLSPEDRRLLSAIRMVPGSTEESLFELAGKGKPFIDFHLALLNLEDRLLIFKSGNGIHLNPLLEADLAPSLSESFVIDSRDVETTGLRDPGFWLDEAYLAALYCFCLEKSDLLTVGASLKKRAQEDYAERFASVADLMPGLSDSSSAAERVEVLGEGLELALSACIRLGLLVPRTAGLSVNRERWIEFAELPTGTRMLLFYSACLLADLEESLGQGSGFFGLSELAQHAVRDASWLSRLGRGRVYTEEALRILFALEPGPETRFAPVFRKLTVLGVLVPHGNYWRINENLESFLEDGVGVPSEANTAGGGNNAPTIILTPSYELSVSSGTDFTALIRIAGFCVLEYLGVAARYAFNKASVQSALEKSADIGEFVTLVEASSGRSLPQNIAFSLGEWQKDFESIRVYDGIVVVAQSSRRAYFEETSDLAPFIVARPAPGVFVLDRVSFALWLPIIRSLGISLPGFGSFESVDTVHDGERFFPPFRSVDLSGIVYRSQAAIEEHMDFYSTEGPGREELAGELLRILASRDMSDDLREELERRIRSATIIFPSQLDPHHVRLEHSEARSLDYTAKVRLIEQAIKSRRDFVEITQIVESAANRKFLVWPQKLRQVGAEMILSAQTIPEGKDLSIVIGKVLVVRKIRASIFS